MIRSGDLRHTVTFQRTTQARDAHGEPIDTWAAIDTSIPNRKVAIYPLRGREYWTGRQTDADITHKIVARYDAVTATVTPKDRILYGSRVFEIASVINVEEKNTQIDIMAKERV